MIYLDLISKIKPGYGVSNNWIIIQDSDTTQKWFFFTKSKEDLTKFFSTFLNKMNTMRKNVKINICDNVVENKTLEENCMKYLNKLTLNLCDQALYRKMT